MVPPYLGAFLHLLSCSLQSTLIYRQMPAYYGVATGNTSMINEAYNQISLYRDELRDPTTNLWRHVVLGTSFEDLGLWATGNLNPLILSS